MFERQRARLDLGLFNEQCNNLYCLTSGLTDRTAPERKEMYLKIFKKMTAELRRLMDDELAYIFKEAGRGPIDRKTAEEINVFVGVIKNVTDRWVRMNR